MVAVEGFPLRALSQDSPQGMLEEGWGHSSWADTVGLYLGCSLGSSVCVKLGLRFLVTF